MITRSLSQHVYYKHKPKIYILCRTLVTLEVKGENVGRMCGGGVLICNSHVSSLNYESVENEGTPLSQPDSESSAHVCM